MYSILLPVALKSSTWCLDKWQNNQLGHETGLCLAMSSSPNSQPISVRTTTATLATTTILLLLVYLQFYKKYIHITLNTLLLEIIQLKNLEYNNGVNPQTAWANLGGPHLYLY